MDGSSDSTHSGAISTTSATKGKSKSKSKSPVSKRHFVIVGAGVIGASTAYYLASHPQRHGASITIVEASGEVAPGASSKSGGFMASDWHDEPTASLGQLSYELHAELAVQHNGAEQWGYRTLDTYGASIDATGGPHKVDSGRLQWLNSSVLDKKPHRLGNQSNTAQVTPGRLCHFLISHAQSTLDVKLMLNTSVQTILSSRHGRIRGVTVSQGGQNEVDLPATDVILCTGPWTGQLLSKSISSTSVLRDIPFVRSASRVYGLRAHSIIVKTAQQTGNQALFVSKLLYQDADGVEKAANPEFYCRGDGTVYACGPTDQTPLPNTVDDVKTDETEVQRLLEQAKVVFLPEYLGPDSEPCLVRGAACYMPMSPETGKPIINFSNTHGLGIAAGHTCWGITLSLGTGKVMSELIFDGEAASADVSDLAGAPESSSEEEDADDD